MAMHRARRLGVRWTALALLAVGLVALPAAAAPRERGAAEGLLAHVSDSVAVHYLIAHPDEAAPGLAPRFRAVGKAIAGVRGQAEGPEAPPPLPIEADRFNDDGLGLPQNEESVAVCRSNPSIVLSGTNDFRGLLDPEGNFTGWHLSTDGGETLLTEGLLPPVEIAGNPVPSGGDPVDVIDADCDIYASSLNYDPFDPFGQPNGIGVYKTDAATLASCPGGSDPSCWPTRRAVATAAPPHFLDKEWLHVGVSGGETVVWVVFADFTIDPDHPVGFSEAREFAVRCDADLVDCTDPILISGNDKDVQFGDITVGPDGRTYVTWAKIEGELEQEAQTFVVKLRIAPAGSTSFGPTRHVRTERRAIPFGGFLQANDFRVATYPKHEVKLVNGSPRIYVVWDACRARVFDTICEYPRIFLKYSDDDGQTWTEPKELSKGGVNYFPAIADDPTSGNLAVTWFTNRFDRFQNAQDVELVTMDENGIVVKRQRLTKPSNETEADPLLGGFFIGDYIETFAHAGTAYTGYNANYRLIRLLGIGSPVAQQDNYLTKAGL